MAVPASPTLYVGGIFSGAMDGTLAEGLAMWKDGAWSAVGGSLGDGYVYAMVLYRNQLVITGWFSRVGNVAASSIAAWDGAVWTPFGSGLSAATGYVLLVVGDDLICGGRFSNYPGQNIAAWNGNSWASVGAGFNDAVHSLAVFQGALYAGGEFTKSGSTSTGLIARWDGTAWRPLDGGLYADSHEYEPRVQSLLVYDDVLYVGGVFDYISGGVRTNRLATWNGRQWSAYYGVMHSELFVLAFFGSTVFAGGYSPSNYDWTPLMQQVGKYSYFETNSIFDGRAASIKALASPSNDRVFVGGSFDAIGDVNLGNIAHWNGTAWTNLNGGIGFGAVYALLAVQAEEATNLLSVGVIVGVAAAGLALLAVTALLLTLANRRRLRHKASAAEGKSSPADTNAALVSQSDERDSLLAHPTSESSPKSYLGANSAIINE